MSINKKLYVKKMKILDKKLFVNADKILAKNNIQNIKSLLDADTKTDTLVKEYVVKQYEIPYSFNVSVFLIKRYVKSITPYSFKDICARLQFKTFQQLEDLCVYYDKKKKNDNVCWILMEMNGYNLKTFKKILNTCDASKLVLLNPYYKKHGGMDGFAGNNMFQLIIDKMIKSKVNKDLVKKTIIVALKKNKSENLDEYFNKIVAKYITSKKYRDFASINYSKI